MDDEQNISTSSNLRPTDIDIASTEEAINILNKPEMSEDEIHKMIATLNQTLGGKTMKTPFLPKGTVLIGTGEEKWGMSFPP
jgi:hypothetical protein